MPAIPLLVGTMLLYVLSLIAGLAYAGFYALAITGMYRTLTGSPVAAGPVENGMPLRSS